MTTERSKQGFGLVRDADGNPRIDGDPHDLDPAIQIQLTVDERRALGLWDGAFVRDADGIKRLVKDGDDYITQDNLRAASEIYDGNTYFRLSQRIDMPAGGRIIRGN